MHVTQLSLSNFRGIRHLDIEFDKNITVIVAPNGSGKTSILDALAIMLFPLQQMWPRENDAPTLNNTTVHANDIRVGEKTCSITLDVYLGVSIDGANTYRLEEVTNPSGQPNLHPSYERLWHLVTSKPSVFGDQTLAIYYRQSRGFNDKSGADDYLTRRALIQGSLSTNLRAISSLERWWDKRDAQEARQVRDLHDPKFRDSQLEAIRNLITEIDGFEAVQYHSEPPEGLYFQKRDKLQVHVDQLSSGERSFIILLADLARRLQIMHPTLPLKRIPGIVLIDEIELNLHPAWQSRILTTLQRVFSNCQFIVTTHSPQVVSSVHNDHVRILKQSEDGSLSPATPLSTKGRTSNYLLEGIFGATERSPEIDRLFDDFNNAIDDGNPEVASKLLEQLTASIDGNPPELMVLKNRLKKLAGAA